MRNPNPQQAQEFAAITEIITQRRLHQQNANRIDMLGAMLDAKITADNTNTVTGWVDTTAALISTAQKTPVLYVDPATSKPFAAIK